MKKIGLLILAIYPAFSYSQDCISSKDCLEKALAERDMKPTFEYFEKSLKFAKKEGANESEIYLQRGLQWYHEYPGHLKDAEKDFRSAIKEDDKNVQAHLMLADVIGYDDDHYKDGIEYYNTLVKKFPTQAIVFYKRGLRHVKASKYDIAATDFEMAFNLIVDDPSMASEQVSGDIARRHYDYYMKNKKIYVADENALKILEAGYKLSPSHAQLIGDLALAYYDNDNKDKAFELAQKARSIDDANTGSLLLAVKAFDAQEFREAAGYISKADNAALSTHGHPLISYYFALIQWQYIYNDAKHLWSSYEAMIKNRFEMCIRYGAGTKYDSYAKDAQSHLKSLQR